MKYLLGYLEGISDAPSLSDPDFQQLLVDVQATKTKSSDAFYDSLEKIVNELRSSPEAVPFLKPVSKRDAPDYYQYITKPMDLSAVLRNVKSHKYKNKTDFATDLDLIWKNCLTYNSSTNHPLRAVAKYLQQKANHHLEFLADRNDTSNNPLLSILSAAGASAAVQQRAASQQPSGAPNGDDENAAGDSDDADGEEDDQPTQKKMAEKRPPPGFGDPNGRATPDVGASKGRAASVGSAPGERRANGMTKANGDRVSPPPFRPNLQPNLDVTTALIRTPYTMTHLQPVSLSEPGPSFSDKGKAREILYGNAPPPWYPSPVATDDDEDGKLEGYWWGLAGKDEGYVAGLPVVPSMVEGPSSKRRCISRRRRRRPATQGLQAPPQVNGSAGSAVEPSEGDTTTPSKPPPRAPKPVSMESVVERSVDKLVDARRTMNIIQQWQHFEMEGGAVPPPLEPPEVQQARQAEERAERKRKRREARTEGSKRRKTGGEVGETEAANVLKRAVAGLLAHSGFEAANDIPLDLFTRVAATYLHNLGRTFRLFLDGFGSQMNLEEITLHVLHENGRVELQDLEAHMKDDITRDGGKVAEMQRKMRAAYREVLAGPVIEDDMLFAQDGQMLQHGDFAEDLGEDFLGLRELGIDKEFGLSSLSVPRTLFFGRRGRAPDTAADTKAAVPDYPPPPPFVPLVAATFKTHTPALMHAFFEERLAAGTGIEADDAFDAGHTSIGPLGQIVQKATTGVAAKKAGKKDANGEPKKKKPAKKTGQPGVGKGNWIRPSKEERQRRAAEKKALLEQQAREAAAAAAAANGEEDDAEGDEE